MKSCRLSIITVCYNEKERIDNTCRSIVSQSYRDFQWIVIDGGSTDGTQEIIDKYAKHIDYFYTGKDEGLYYAMNIGIQHATGEFCIFLNGGDFFVSDGVLKKIDWDVQRDIITCDILWNDGKRKFVMHKLGKSKKFIKYIFGKWGLFSHPFPHQATFFKRNLFVELGLYDTHFRLLADLEFTLRSLSKKKLSVSYQPVIIAEYNLEGISAKPENKYQFNKEFSAIRKKYYCRFERVFLFIKTSLRKIYLSSKIILKRLLILSKIIDK